MRTLLAAPAALALALAAGCALDPLAPAAPPPTETPPADETPGDVPLLGPGVDCDPMVPTACGYPFPSSIYLVDDPATPTGKRVHFGATTLPAYGNEGVHVDRATWSDSDGFSPGQAPMTHMPGATVAGLPTQDTIPVSITVDSPTILLDADTGELVPHFSELDMSTPKADQRALMIRPVVRLKDATRYIVAIRRVVDEAGAPLPPNPVFQALRDGVEHPDPSVRLRRALYDDIFARLEAAGVTRADLQIAWDYVTASRENNTRWLVHMRDDALAAVGEEGPEYTIVSVVEDPNPYIRRRILGTMKVPLYLDQPGPGGRLVFGTDGLPMRTGTAEYEFLVHIPNSATQGIPGALLQNGHGLLGTKNEGRNGYLAQIADMKRFVAFGVDLVGMAEDDEDTVREAILGDIGQMRASIDRQHQGILNSLLAMRMMKGRFFKDPLVQFNGVSAIDPTHCYYRGDSQGGIFGATYMALSTDVTRGLLGEPGMPYNLLLNRSVDFSPFFLLLRVTFDGPLDIQLGLGLVQMLWDRTEPNGYAPYIRGDTLPGTPSHDVLIHAAIGDYQVTPLGAHILARTVGAMNLSPVNRSVWGIDERPSPFSGSGLVEFSFGLPEAPKTNTPPKGPEADDPHDKVRVLDAARSQTDTFLRTGEVRAYCDGVCDPE